MTILTKLPVVVEAEPLEERKPFLNETMARQVLFTEKPKPDRQSPDKTATKTLLKTLILEAWNELA
jgi:hypothetical protein